MRARHDPRQLLAGVRLRATGDGTLHALLTVSAYFTLAGPRAVLNVVPSVRHEPMPWAMRGTEHQQGPSCKKSLGSKLEDLAFSISRDSLPSRYVAERGEMEGREGP